MDFLNKHYEKLILLGMLLFFIIAMVNVLSIASQTGEVKDTDLQIPTRQADHKPENAADKKYTPETILQTGTFVWKKAEKRDKTQQLAFHSDTVSFPKLSTCLIGKDDTGKESGCGALVPLIYFQDKPCPNCGRVLKKAPERKKFRRNQITNDDSDGDGMPNAYETSNNLEPNNPYDALYDADGDGFSNIFEMEQQTDPRNPRLCPPLWYRLRFVAVRSVVLPISFKALNINGQEKDPKRWDIQLNVKMTNRSGKTFERTILSRLNGTVEIEKRRYRIKRIERIISDSSGSSKKKENLVAGGKIGPAEDKAQDLSKIYLEEELSFAAKKNGDVPDKLEMQIGKPVLSSDRRPIFEDVGKPEGKRDELVVRLGETFRLRTPGGKVSVYKLNSFDEKKMVASLIRGNVRGKEDASKDERGKPMIITRDGMIGDDSCVIEQVSGPKESVDVREQDSRTTPGRRRR